MILTNARIILETEVVRGTVTVADGMIARISRAPLRSPMPSISMATCWSRG